MARLFNGGEMKKLKPLEGHFFTAVNLNYKNNTNSEENNTVADLYERVTGEKVDRRFACPKCVFDLYKKCGKIYYDTLKHAEDKKKAPQETA